MATAVTADTNAKTLYCIRHGESTFNEWRRQSILNFSWIWVRDPMIIDAPLSRKGEQQADRLHHSIKAQRLDARIDVIITSPLTRAIQTMAGAFRDASIPILLEPSCREMLDTACDIGRQPQDLAASFVTVAADFHALDQFWWLPPHKRPSDDATARSPMTHAQVLPLRETSADVDARIRELLLLIRDLPAQHQHVAIVGHSAFFKRMLGMNRKLHNCELVTVSFTDVAERFGVSLVTS